MRNTMSGSDRLFHLAFVRPPSDSYTNCVSTNPSKGDIDVTLAREQHRTYTSILKEAGVEVIGLQPLEAYPDSVFMQDPALLGASRSIVGRFGEETRRGEAKALTDELRAQRAKVGGLYFVNPPGTLEGGDVVVTDRGIFVGDSKRTNTSGIKQLNDFLANQDVTAVRTELMHLLCGCSYLSNGTMIIAPDLVNPDSFPRFRFIRIPERESYATDALYLGEDKVLIPSGFPRTVAKLKDACYRPIEIDVSEFWKGDGGVTCLSSPVFELF
jgi:dimethylargininase